MTDEDNLRQLLDAGFTLDELRGIGEALHFAEVVAGGLGESQSADLSCVDWTPQKYEAYKRYLTRFLAAFRAQGETPDA